MVVWWVLFVGRLDGFGYIGRSGCCGVCIDCFTVFLVV